MKREFVAEIKCELNLSSPFDFEDVIEGLKEAFVDDRYVRCTGHYVVPIGWNFQEMTSPDNIIEQIGEEMKDYPDE